MSVHLWVTDVWDKLNKVSEFLRSMRDLLESEEKIQKVWIENPTQRKLFEDLNFLYLKLRDTEKKIKDYNGKFSKMVREFVDRDVQEKIKKLNK